MQHIGCHHAPGDKVVDPRYAHLGDPTSQVIPWCFRFAISILLHEADQFGFPQKDLLVQPCLREHKGPRIVVNQNHIRPETSMAEPYSEQDVLTTGDL
jgi:hypothetical protein